MFRAVDPDYCITGKFRDMKISRILAIGNFATGKCREFSDGGASGW